MVIGGDCNTDISPAQSTHTTALHAFCQRNCLKLCLRLTAANIDYEYVTGCRSTLDHFIVSDNLASQVISSDVTHDGNNLSDHNAVCLCLDILVQYTEHVHKQFTPHPLWKRATEHELLNYKYTLSTLLEGVNVPKHVINCTELLCSKHVQAINSYSCDIIDACMKATKLCIPHSNRHKRVAGWTDKVKPYKERSIFWHRLWADNGKPRQGVIFNIMHKCRLDYKRISKKVIKSQNNLKLERMAKSIVDDSSRNFWREIRTISKKNRGNLPNNVDNVIGDNEICDMFCNKYENLYKEVPYDEVKMQSIINNVNHNVSSVI